MVRDLSDFEPRARRIVERLALLMQGSLMVRHAAPSLADAFCASRLSGDHGTAFGTLPAHCDYGKIVARANPREAA